MSKKQNIALGKVGMDSDTHPSGLTEMQYTYAKNLNLENESGNTLNASSEHSNILATKFKNGFKVIHAVNDIDTTNTYFFLVNPTTGVGEFGVVENNQATNDLEDLLIDCDECHRIKQLAEPLETLNQVALQTYTTLISDECHVLANEPEKGFMFNILNPIKKSVIKNEKCGKTIYFSHKGNPPRHINIDRIDDYFIQEVPCADDITLSCPDFDKMRVFKLFNIPEIEPASIELGGNLRMGMYEFLIAYCNSGGQEISEYYSITNPISIFDENNKIMNSNGIADRTNYSIRLNISGVDAKYPYYKVAVIETTDIENSSSIFKVGVFSSDITSILYSTSGNLQDDGQRMSTDEVYRKFPVIEETIGVATANNILYQYGITNKKELNLQPVVNFIGEMGLKWQTHIAPEDLYKNGVNISKYLGINREEVVPYGIKFLLEGGYETAVFPFIGRQANSNDRQVVVDEEGEIISPTNRDVTSILSNKKNCTKTNRKEYWQYYNTATVDSTSCGSDEDIETVTVPEKIDKSCKIEEVHTIPANTIEITLEQNESYIDLATYINDNKGEDEAECNLNILNVADICDAMYNEYPAMVCTPDIEGTCTQIGTPEIEVKISEVVNEVVTYIPRTESEYVATLPPRGCFPFQRNDTTSGYKQDDDTKNLFRLCSNNLYLRDIQTYNDNCAYAEEVYYRPKITPGAPPPQGIGIYHNYKFSHFFNDVYYNKQAGTDPLKGINLVTQKITMSNFSIGTVSGQIDIKIGGSTYSTAIATDRNITLTNIYNTHKTAIETQTGGTLVFTGSEIKLISPSIMYIDRVTTSSLSVNMLTSFSVLLEVEGEFCKNLHKNALFFKANRNSKNKIILDISKATTCKDSDYVSNAGKVRYTIYKDCTLNIILDEGVCELSSGFIKIMNTTSYPESFIIAIDTPIRHYPYKLQGCDDCTDETVSIIDLKPKCNYESSFYLSTACGCFSLFLREEEYSKVEVSWDSIKLSKQMNYSFSCLFDYPVVKSCKAFPFKKGDFSFWESERVYPDNNALYNSSVLNIKPSDIPVSYRTKFESLYTNGINSGNYTWKLEAKHSGGTPLPVTDFTCRKQRHFKMPSNLVSPFMTTTKLQPFISSIIFPLGVTLNEEIVNVFLDIAVKNNLVSNEDRKKIKGYELVRGDLSRDRSITSAGMLFDMRDYMDKNTKVLYSNYPFNSYSSDKFNKISNEYIGVRNNNFTYHSPETDYYRPTLPSEMSVQGYLFGKTKYNSDEVRGHSKWVILSDKATNLANNLAILEATAEATLATMDQFSNYNQQVGISSTVFTGSWVSMIVTAIVGGATAAIYKVARYRYEWLNIFQNLGTPYNFAYYMFGEGDYNYLKTLQTEGNTLRSLNVAKHLKDRRTIVTNEVTGEKININNWRREYSVFLSTGENSIFYPDEYRTFDKESMTYLGENGVKDAGRSTTIYKNIASPYVYLKNYLPEQHGDLHSIQWVSTGYRGDLTNPKTTCLPIFGGDTFIGRHEFKRKHSQFTEDAVYQADRTPFNYFYYNNIGKDPLFAVSYNINKDFEGSSKIFPDIVNDLALDNTATGSSNYYTPPSKFYLYHYGKPSFLCESRINTNFAYGGEKLEERTPDTAGDFGDWTQEKTVSIKEKNHFYYNKAYSKNKLGHKNRMIPSNYDTVFNTCKADFPNGVVSSLPDNSENNDYDPWLIYRPNDFYEFPSNYGNLIDVQGIENEAILTRFENTSILWNKVDYTNDDGQNPTKPFLGGTSVFQRRSASFYNAQLGFGGTQNTTSVSCEYGHFHVDAMRGQVIQTQPSGNQMEEISSIINGKPSGKRNWFKEHLSFKIKKYFKNIDVDNNYNGVGISMGWDSRYRRVFITKKDYVPKNQNITYSNGKFYSGEVEVKLTNSQYFEDVSWTIAYSPILGTWMSFYDFHPNYYVSHNNYFQTGVNSDDNKSGLWSHLLTNKSYLVFYGSKHSFDIELPLKAENVTKKLEAVTLWTEAIRYENAYDTNINNTLTFNKSLIWNNVGCSGQMNLIPQKNNLKDNKNYPKTNSDNTQDILISNKDNFQWSYNYFFDRVKSTPFLNNDKNQINKTVNNYAIAFKGNKVLKRLNGDWFLNRLSYDKDSRYKLMLKFMTTISEV